MCITKTDGTKIDAENLDLVMLMYDLLEYSLCYSDKAGNLWFYSKDKAANFDANIEDNDNFKSFRYKPRLIGNKNAVDRTEF